MGGHVIADAAARPAGGVSEKRLALGLAAFCAAAFLFNLYGTASFIHDDSLIGFRYVRNLVASGDFSWNPGDRVEGYTNFLDLVLVAGLTKLGLDPLTAARGLHALAAAAMFALAAWRAGDLAPRQAKTRARAFALAALLGCGGVPMWIWGGLETLLAAAFVTAGVAVIAPVFARPVAQAWRACALAGVLFALAVLTRPDNVVAGVAAGGSLLLFAPMALRARLMLLAAFSVAPVLIVGAHEVFRIAYYGDWLPNTFWAKSGAPPPMTLRFAVEYLAASAGFVLALWVFLVFLGMGLARRGAEGKDRVLWLIGTVAGMQFVYVVLIGGDHMPAGRFFLPVIGAVAIGAGLIAAHATRERRMALAVSLAAAAGFGLMHTATHWRPTDGAAVVGAQTGRLIDKAWPQGSLVALHTAGSTPWFAPGHAYIDMLGLNDRVIARKKPTVEQIASAPFSMPGHLRGDAASVLAREPDYVILGPAEGTRLDRPWFITDLEMAKSEAFKRCYVERTAKLARTPGGPAAELDLFVYFERTCRKTVR